MNSVQNGESFLFIVGRVRLAPGLAHRFRRRNAWQRRRAAARIFDLPSGRFSTCTGVWTFLVPEGLLETSPRFQPWDHGTEKRSSTEASAEYHSHNTDRNSRKTPSHSA